MDDIIVRDLKMEEYELWDRLVESSPHGTIFHESSWLTTCEKLFNKKLKIYGCFEHGQLIGGCPLYIHKSLFFKTASSAIEMTPYGGIIMPNERYYDTIESYYDTIEPLLAMFDSEHFDRIKLVNSPNVMDVRPFIWNGWETEILYTYYLDLNNFKLSRNIQRNIKNAIKNDIIVEKAEHIPLFYELFRETFFRKGSKPPVTEKFFNIIFNTLKNQNKCEMWIARTKSGDIAASEIVIYDNKRAYRWAAVSHIELRKTGASSLLLSELFQDLKKRGFREINLMAANRPKLARFSENFYPSLIPYYVVKKSNLISRSLKEIYTLREKI